MLKDLQSAAILALECGSWSITVAITWQKDCFGMKKETGCRSMRGNVASGTGKSGAISLKLKGIAADSRMMLVLHNAADQK